MVHSKAVLFLPVAGPVSKLHISSRLAFVGILLDRSPNAGELLTAQGEKDMIYSDSRVRALPMTGHIQLSCHLSVLNVLDRFSISAIKTTLGCIESCGTSI